MMELLFNFNYYVKNLFNFGNSKFNYYFDFPKPLNFTKKQPTSIYYFHLNFSCYYENIIQSDFFTCQFSQTFSSNFNFINMKYFILNPYFSSSYY